MDGWAARLEAPVAVVTGASRGIGRAIAVALGKAGCKVLSAACMAVSCHHQLKKLHCCAVFEKENLHTLCCYEETFFFIILNLLCLFRLCKVVVNYAKSGMEAEEVCREVS
jgi:hypothetical protein